MLLGRVCFRIVEANRKHLEQARLVVAMKGQVGTATGAKGPMSTDTVVKDAQLTREDEELFHTEGGSWQERSPAELLTVAAVARASRERLTDHPEAHALALATTVLVLLSFGHLV